MQAGPVAEGTGPRAGPDRVLGRGSSRGLRPWGRPNPGARPGTQRKEPACWPVQADAQAGRRSACADAGGDGDQKTVAGEGIGSAGKGQNEAGLTLVS